MTTGLEEKADLELDDYTRVRFHEARAAGLTRLEAARFAQGREPLRTLRLLKAGGCPSATIARIVT
jgi:hypothetical protein